MRVFIDRGIPHRTTNPRKGIKPPKRREPVGRWLKRQTPRMDAVIEVVVRW